MNHGDSAEGLLRLVLCDSMKELKRQARSLVIDSRDFADFTWSCGALGLLHQIDYRDIVPAQLALTPDDLAIPSSSEAPGPAKTKSLRMAKKVLQIFRDRRHLVGHMFYTPSLDYWHFFYFDQRDRRRQQNHWEHGAHIHFLNYLWPEHSAQGVWEQFTQGNPKMRGKLHIRWHEDRPDGT